MCLYKDEHGRIFSSAGYDPESYSAGYRFPVEIQGGRALVAAPVEVSEAHLVEFGINNGEPWVENGVEESVIYVPSNVLAPGETLN